MSIPSDPWAFLGLDRASANGRDVKRAYARLLKLHRPDQDPEGFQRVNDAYQRALRDLAEAEAAAAAATAEPVAGGPDVSASGGVEALGAEPGKSREETASLTAGSGGPEPEAENSPAAPSSADGENAEPSAVAGEAPPVEKEPAASPPGPRRLEDFPELPAAFLTAFEKLMGRLRQAAPSPDMPEFNVLRNMVREDPALAPPWVAVLETLFGTERGLPLLPQMHARDVLLLMLAGESSCAARIILSWRDDPALVNRLAQLGNLMLERKVADNPAMLGAMHFTARMSAFHLPHVSARLADELYRQTGPGVREQIVREIEVRSAAGRVFSILSHPQRRFWEHQFFESGEGGTDWSHPENAAALQAVMLNCSQNWEGWPLIAQLIPQETLEEALRKGRLAQAEATAAERRDFVKAHPGRAFLHWLAGLSGWVPSGRWLLVALWLGVHLGSVVYRSGSSHSSSRPVPPPSSVPLSSLFDSRGRPLSAPPQNPEARTAGGRPREAAASADAPVMLDRIRPAAGPDLEFPGPDSPPPSSAGGGKNGRSLTPSSGTPLPDISSPPVFPTPSSGSLDKPFRFED